MKKTMTICDCCHREAELDDRIYLKVGNPKHGRPKHLDICEACWTRILEACKEVEK